ncbi:Na+/H+ antiporter subunit A [Nocardioides litoris]|uniref:Na+/H+ antiporter subunit A n=1 Tax=Nocardioides litoris TaxID=1926648 RepID=UPI001B85EE40|nr:Na+/H+ antiporter subunit A [Nocardioides litoris]
MRSHACTRPEGQALLALVLAHGVAAAVAPGLVRWLGRRAFVVLALAPLAAVVWAVVQAPEVLDGGVLVESTAWIPELGVTLDLTLDALRWLMVLVVAGVGVVVLAYCAWYFDDPPRRTPGTRGSDEPLGSGTSLVGFSSSFIAFVGAMLGLVLADDLLLLFVFWELTTISSFLLIGFNPVQRKSRRAAVQALLVTTFGGLAMLVGVIVLGEEAGSYSLAAIVADPPSGTATTVAVWLVLLGALTKSAIVPFQFWLPGAMAAPTPVSAYLHAASMVKAGLLLVALLVPAFADTPGWRPVLLTLGVVTMVSGGWRALRQIDIKLLLAHGTVSQLGFLLVMLAAGTRTAALAGAGLVLAHALFKSTLFLSVGVVDKLAGTRDLHQLSGVGRRLPVVAVAATLAGLSMAGLPPLVGFLAKETMWAGLLELTEAGNTAGVAPWAGWLLVVGVLVGSTFTVGYTARFLWGAFAAKPGVAATEVKPLAAPFAAGPALLALAGLGLGFAGHALTSALTPYADQLAEAPGPDAKGEYLALWHGLELPLALSAATVVAGLALFAVREPFCRFQQRVELPVSGTQAYREVLRVVDRTAVEVTGTVQRGSASAYLAIILLVVAAGPGTALVLALVDGPELRVYAWDSWGQPVVGLVMAAAALFTVRSRRRLRAFVLAGITGYGCALLFVLHGAPDIALTQVLVETVTLVVIVLVLRRLPDYFTDRRLRPTRYLRMALAAVIGAATTGFLVVAGSSRSVESISARFAQAAYDFGYGKNVVNVTLVDIRAWDTFGEISVVVVAATGVASLIFLDTRSAGVRRLADADPRTTEMHTAERERPTRSWLPAPATMSPDRRSIVFEVVTRLVFHSILVFSLYLLLAGHNLPGGGFAAGMVAGLALMVRYLAGGRYELAEALPVDAGVLIGAGLFVAAVSGLGPTAFGGEVLQTADVYVGIPLLGELHLVSSVGFDIGVYLVVVGLVLDLLRTFGARLDRQLLRAQRGDDEGAEMGVTEEVRA